MAQPHPALAANTAKPRSGRYRIRHQTVRPHAHRGTFARMALRPGTVRMDDHTWDELARHATYRGVSRNYVINEACVVYLIHAQLKEQEGQLYDRVLDAVRQRLREVP